jgi:hypothetical protein
VAGKQSGSSKVTARPLSGRKPTLKLDTLEDRSVPAIVLTGAENWYPTGPAPIGGSFLINVPGTPSNQSTGAVEDILPHPTDPNILFAGGVNGGVWRTFNAQDPNPTWTPLTDNLPSLTIGAMDMNPNNPNQILVGIGAFSSAARISGDMLGIVYTQNALAPNPTFRTIADPLLIDQDVYGVIVRDNYLLVAGTNGVFRSTDNGTTWTTLSGTGGLPRGGLVGGIFDFFFDAQADPSDPNRVYVSSDSGIYRTDNINAPVVNWTNLTIPTMNIAFGTTVRNKISIHSTPGNNIVYFGVVNNEELDNVHWSDNLGQTWNQMDTPAILTGPAPVQGATLAGPIAITSNNHGLATGARVVISGVQGNLAANSIWTITVTDANTFTLNGSIGTGNYVADTGEWRRVFGVNPGQQGSLHFAFRADPTNPNILYLAGDRQDGAFPTSTGANTFTATTMRGNRSIAPTFGEFGLSPQWTPLSDSFTNGTAPYPDARDFRIDPNGHLLYASDGGIYRIANPTVGNTNWTSVNGNLEVGQFYQLRYDIQNNAMFGGMQDSGSPGQVSGFGPVGSLNWQATLGGDGFWQDVDNISQASNGLTLRYSQSNTITSLFRLTYNSNNTLEGAPVRVELASPASPGTLYSGLTNADVGRFGLNVFAINAVDGAQFMLAMTSLYEDNDPAGLAGDVIADVTPTGYTGVGTAVAYGGKQNGVAFSRIAYVGTSSGQLWIRGATGGMTQSTKLPGSGRINDITLDPDNWRRAYILRGNGVYITEDGGKTFRDLTENLIAQPVNGKVYASDGTLFSGLTTQALSLTIYDQNPGLDDGNNLIFVGGNNGVFSYTPTSPTKGTWSRFRTGLPNAIVNDLQVYNNRLIAGTQGRGAWALPAIANNIVNVIGDDSDNAMSMTADPTDPGYFYVSDGLGNTQRFLRASVRSVNFQGLGGADTITISADAGPNGTLNFIQLPVSIDAGGNAGDTLLIQDAGRTTPTRVTITEDRIGAGTTLTSGGNDNLLSSVPGTSLTYKGLENGTLILDIGENTPGGNLVLVQSTSAGNTRILGSSAGDIVIVDSAGGLTNDGNTAAIAGDVSFDGRSGTDTLIVGETSSTSGNQNVVIGNTSISNILGQVSTGSVNYENVSTITINGSNSALNPESYTIINPAATLNLNTNDGPDSVNLRANGRAVNINTGDGNDTVRISSNAGQNDEGDLGQVLGSVNVDAGAGTNRLIVSNFGNASPGVYNITGSTIVGATNGPISYFSTGGNFSNGTSKNGVWVRGSNVADDTFSVDAFEDGSQLLVEGNGGNDIFNINVQIVSGSIWLHGGADNDTFRFNSGSIGNQATSLTFSGGGGNDTTQVQGFASKQDNSTITLLTQQAGVFAGLGKSFNFDTMRLVNYDALTGRNTLTITNGTQVGYGSPSDPASGVVYQGTGGESGTITIANGTVGPILSFSNINGADNSGLIYNGNPTGGNGKDTLTVLGYSTIGENSTGTGSLQGGSVRDGSDKISVSDQVVTIRNSSLNYIRPIAIAQVNGQPSIANLIVLGGNEPNRFGDEFTVTPSSKIKIIVDAQGPSSSPGDRLNVSSSETTQLNSANDPSLGRTVSQVITPSGSSLTFLRFENTGLVGNYFAVGADVGGGPRVVVYDAVTRQPVFDGFVYNTSFTGGVRVAMGDVTGDGIPDLVTAAGVGGGPHIQVFDGLNFKLVSSFFAYESSFRGGLYVAVGDVNGDGKGEIVTGTGMGGGPLVRVFDSTGSILTGFFAYNNGFRGGVRVAVGDTNGDGIADIVTGAGPGGGPHVRIFSGNDLTILGNYLSGDPSSTTGVYVAAGDLDGDGAAEVASGPGGNDAPVVTIRRSKDGTNVNLSVFDIGIIGSDDSLPNAPSNVLTAQGGVVDENSGVRVAIAPFDPDSGTSRLIVSRGAGNVPRIRAYGIDPLVEVGNFLPFEASFEGGVFVG